MAVFTALRNKALSTASGFLAKTASSALGLDRAKDIRFNQPSTNPVTGNPQTTRGGEILQYPLNLGSDGNSHFVAFFIKQIDPSQAEITSATNGRNKNEQKAKEASQNMGAAGDSDGDEENVKQLTANQKQMAAANQRQIGSGGKRYLSIQEKKRTTSKLVKTIALYFPPSVQQQYNLSYNEQEISKQAAFGAEVIEGFMAKGFTGDQFKKATDSAMKGIKLAINQMGIAALDNIAPGSKALIALNRGKVIAPKMEVMFEGIGKRSFSYSFTFTPTSEQEANEVQKIIQAFRFHASSDYADDFGFELEIPDQFEIEYYTKGNQPNGYLHKIGTCVLESVDVTYGGDKMTWHETNSKGASPTKTTIALSVKELMTVTKQAIEDGF